MARQKKFQQTMMLQNQVDPSLYMCLLLNLIHFLQMYLRQQQEMQYRQTVVLLGLNLQLREHLQCNIE